MDPSAVKTLAQTTVNSLGQPIAWPQGGTPEVTALLVEMAPGEEFPWHKHPVPLHLQRRTHRLPNHRREARRPRRRSLA
jgi:quercetin dioxygenase-like cupin family protein